MNALNALAGRPGDEAMKDWRQAMPQFGHESHDVAAMQAWMGARPRIGQAYNPAPQAPGTPPAPAPQAPPLVNGSYALPQQAQHPFGMVGSSYAVNGLMPGSNPFQLPRY